MKKFSYRKSLLVLAASFFLLAGQVWCQPEQRYFDKAPKKSEDVRLTIFHPTKGNIQTLIGLRKQNLISIQNLTIIGLYHEKQAGSRETARSYEEAVAFVEENGYDWIHFHRLEGNLAHETLFENKDLRDELLRIFSLSDGLLLFGGADIPSSLYGEKTNLLTDIETPYRSYIETAAVFHILGGWQDERSVPYCESRKEFPVLGLCLGSQSLNVGTGGSLYQDIPSEVYGVIYIEDIIALGKENWHVNPYAKLNPLEFRSNSMHKITLLSEGKFVREWGFRKENGPYVYSSHHQAVKTLGKGVRIIATSLDGKVVEAIEHTTYPNVLGVQFHPEARSLWDRSQKSRSTPEDEGRSLFSILENHPPSLDFHKNVWSWFSQKLAASQRSRNEDEK